MKLLDLKQSYQTKQTQFITITLNGIVIESDNVLFSISPKKDLTKTHPFFESTLGALSNSKNLEFSCVHLNIEKVNLVCDISLNKIDANLFLIIITDFSKHYKSFRSLAQSRNETAIESEFLIQKNKFLKEKEVFKNKFIANFSHEVKTPLTSIVSFTSLLKSTKLDYEQREFLDIILSSSSHLKAIINDILDISKIETGKLEIKHNVFNLKLLIDQVKTKYELKCKEKNLKFKVIINQNVPTHIESDKTRIEQLIQNLLNNAIKFTPSGTVSLEFKTIYKRARNMTLSIIVKDTGIGIDPKDNATIFQRFNRLENASKTEGVGLGLTIVKEIVELMNSDLHFDSKPDQGSTFTINLKTQSPLIQDEPVKKASKKDSKKRFKNKPKRKYNILLVEDNATHQLSVFKILAKTKLFYLDIVNNGIDAIKLVSKTKYDVILMDFKLPTLNGLEITQSIRNFSDKQKKQIPIILVTGSILNSSFLEKNKNHFFDIIEKPFEEEHFINTILDSLEE